MKFKASPGLNLLIGVLTMAAATAPVFLIDAWYKWPIAATVLLIGCVIENRVERAYTAATKD